MSRGLGDVYKRQTQIRDNYEKVVLTSERLTVGNYNGIRVKNLTDWLLGKDS